LIAFPAKMVC